MPSTPHRASEAGPDGGRKLARLGKIFYPAVVAAGFAGLGSVKLGRNHRFFTSIGEPLGEGDRISPGAGEVITAAVGKPPDHDAEMGRMRYGGGF